MNEQIKSPDTEHLQIKKSHSALLFVPIILTIVLLILLGLSAYFWMQNHSQQTALKDKDAQIQQLNQQIASFSATTNNSTQTEDIIPIRELGISITVPDSIKDLTYSYIPIANRWGRFEAVDFSTKSLSDKYASTDRSTDECTSFGAAPPLGSLSRMEGTYTPGNDSVLVKQFKGFYIMFSGPQSACSNAPSFILPPQLKDFTQSLSSIKEL